MANEKSRKSVAIMALAEMFGKQLSEPAVRMYLAAMSDVGAEAVERAAAEAASSSKFFPPPAELREMAGVARPEDRAILAWSQVEKAVSRFGAYKTVDFDDPLINAAIRTLGGWVSVCKRDPDEFDKWLRADFLKTYASLTRTGVTGDLCAPLPGLGGRGTVRRIDGSVEKIEPQVIPVRTGLPWAGEPQKRVAAPRKKAPALLSFQKP